MITEEQRQKVLKALRDSYANLTVEHTTEKEFENIIEATEIVKNLIIPNVIHWLTITEELPEHGETVLTYTPSTEMAEEQIRLIRYGSLKNGFPAGVTHWKYLDKPTCI